MIIRGGLNVYPREVEEVLYTHPDVLEAAVVGIPDDLMGEEVGAAVVLSPGATATLDDIQRLRQGAHRRLQVPAGGLDCSTSCPRARPGKILRREVKAPDAAEAQATETAAAQQKSSTES